MNSTAFNELPDELKKLSKEVSFDEDGRIGTSFDELPDELKQSSRLVNFEDSGFEDSLGKKDTEAFSPSLSTGLIGLDPGLVQQAKETIPFAARGAAKGLATPGSLLDLVGAQAQQPLPGVTEMARAEAELLETRPDLVGFLSDDDLLPGSARIPSASDIQKISELLGQPERGETAIQRGAERVGQTLPFLPFGGAAGLLGGAVGGQAVEEGSRALGFESPEFAGDIAEVVTNLAIPSLGKKLPAGGKNAKLIEDARKLNLNDQEIAVLTRNPKTTKGLLKGARKTEKTDKLISGINETLGSSYDVVEKSAEKLPKIGFVARSRLTNRFEKILKDLQSGGKVGAGPRKDAIEFITNRLEDIRGGKVPITPRYLVETFQQANEAIPWRSMKGGSKKLAAIKEPILQELRKASPELAKDFETTNKLYSNFAKISESFKPGMVDNLLDAGKILSGGGTVVTGIATLNPGLILAAVTSVAGAEAGRRLLTSMATNPRFMNMSRKVVEAFNNNKPQVALNVVRKMVSAMAKEADIDEDELLQAFFDQEPQEPQPSPTI